MAATHKLIPILHGFSFYDSCCRRRTPPPNGGGRPLNREHGVLGVYIRESEFVDVLLKTPYVFI
ncbi:hypothetical protein Hanom_Chr07g00581411 [Helianthus anomalus]